MKKILLSLAVIGGLASSTFADDTSDLKTEIDALNKKITKLENQQQQTGKSLAKVRAHDAFDNIKFDIDFRTAYDRISYEKDKKTYKNDALLSNRLLLGMGYQPTEDMSFQGQLAFNKAFGADTNGRGRGYDSFDWIINEALTDDTLRVREAFWLWKSTIGGFKTMLSIGRRPATNGQLINLRDDDKAKSPQGHVINMEFDGLSASIKLDKYISGSYLKFCYGRGLTNAKAKFDMYGLDYAKNTDPKTLDNMDVAGVIAQLYNDGQYNASATYYRGFNVPGIDMATATAKTLPQLRTFGNMDGAALSAQIKGIGDMINDFLDETTLFASVAWSQTQPNAKQAMLGSLNKESGYSYWVGAQVPNLTGGKLGLEYNHGSKYWRPFTYGEDTMIGSKMATRGNAYEAYWTQPIIKKDGKSLFSMQIRYTYLDYDYTGSNGFFGDAGTPLTVAKATQQNMDPVKSSQDLRVYFRYRY